MTRHAHTIRLPSCTVSLGPRAKQETKAYTLLKCWDSILDRHITMVSVFRSLAFCDSLRQICTKTLLCAICQNVGTGFLCTLCSSKPRASLSFEIRASQSLQQGGGESNRYTLYMGLTRVHNEEEGVTSQDVQLHALPPPPPPPLLKRGCLANRLSQCIRSVCSIHQQ